MRSSNALVSALALCCVYENSTTEISWLSWCADPITGIARCCARAASGQAAAAPPSNVMNARRLTRSPRPRGRAELGRELNGQIGNWGTFQYFVHIGCGPMKAVVKINPIAN